MAAQRRRKARYERINPVRIGYRSIGCFGFVGSRAPKVEPQRAPLAVEPQATRSIERQREQRRREQREKQQAVRQAALDKRFDSMPAAEPATEPSNQVPSEPVKRFATVEAYFSDGC